MTFQTPEGPSTVTAQVILASDGAYSATRAAIQFREGFNFSQDFLEHGYKELTIPARPDGRTRWTSARCTSGRAAAP